MGLEVTIMWTRRHRRLRYRKIFILILLGALCLSPLLLAACSTALPKDLAPAPIDMSESRVETAVCGHRAVGKNICWISAPDKTNEVEVSIITYFKGKVVLKAVSSSCNIDDSISYENSQTVTFSLDKYVQKIPDICVITVLVQPEFPGQIKSGVEVRGQSGQIVIQVAKVPPAKLSGKGDGSGIDKDANIYDGSILFKTSEVNSPQVNGLNVSDFSLDTEGSVNGKIQVTGCGIKPYVVSYAKSPVALSVRNILGAAAGKIQSCELYGRVARLDKPDDRAFLIAVEIFDQRSIQLAVPVIKMNWSKIDYYNDDPVAFTFLDDKYDEGGAGHERVADPMLVQFRQITVQGRSKIVELQNGNVVWVR